MGDVLKRLMRCFMKKIFSLVVALVISVVPLVNAAESSDYDFDGVYDGYQVVYSPSANFFSNGGMVEDRIVLTKRTSVGSGSYSEYYLEDKLVLSLGSNFEFLKDGRLIAVHNHDLTFYEVIYKDGEFFEKKMNEEEIKEIFPKAQIIKISEFENKEVSIRKLPFQKLEVLLLNDTEQYFYKYFYEPKDVQKTDVKGLLEISEYGKIEFSHFGQDSESDPKLTIKIKFI